MLPCVFSCISSNTLIKLPKLHKSIPASGSSKIESLVERVAEGGVDEVIFALSSTMEGDATNFYIFRKLMNFPDLKLTVLARGMSINDELQYTDEVTLGRSLVNRVPFTCK